jgi:SAM-dependent methyltransferase
MPDDPTSEEFFEAKYQEEADPWHFATSAYEQDRYSAILRALQPRQFRRVFEPGCSIGILTEKLAVFCDEVEAMDISSTAVSRTRERCGRLGNVTVRHGALPDAVPEGAFDLIVLSEIGYYFPLAVLNELVSELVGRLIQEGTFLAAHWLGSSPDHLLTGDQIHELIGTIPGLTHATSQQHEGFRIDLWKRHD